MDGNKLYLRPLTYEDLPFLLSVRNQSLEYIHNNSVFSLQDAQTWFITTNPNYLIVCCGSTDIGYFRTSNYDPINRHIMAGCDLLETYRGLGLGYKSWLLFLDMAFTTIRVHKVSLEVLETNQRAINLYKKLGFKVDGLKRDEVFRDGCWIGSILMSLIQSDVV